MGGYRYTCLDCGESVERKYRAKYLLSSCGSGCGYVRFVRDSLIEKIEMIPDDSKPEDWPSLSLEGKLKVAFQEGELTYSEIL